MNNDIDLNFQSFNVIFEVSGNKCIMNNNVYKIYCIGYENVQFSLHLALIGRFLVVRLMAAQIKTCIFKRWGKSSHLTRSKSPQAGRPRFDPQVWGVGDFSLLLRVQTGPGIHLASYKMSTGGFPQGKNGRAQDQPPYLFLVPWVCICGPLHLPLGLYGLQYG